MTDINKSGKPYLQILALAFLFIGAIGSQILLFNVGSKQVILLMLFTFWVLSPFAGLLVLQKVSRRWKRNFQLWIYWLTIVVAVISLAVYTVVLTITHLRPASIFLTIPTFSWLIILTFFLIANRLSNKTKDLLNDTR